MIVAGGDKHTWFQADFLQQDEIPINFIKWFCYSKSFAFFFGDRELSSASRLDEIQLQVKLPHFTQISFIIWCFQKKSVDIKCFTKLLVSLKRAEAVKSVSKQNLPIYVAGKGNNEGR